MKKIFKTGTYIFIAVTLFSCSSYNDEKCSKLASQISQGNTFHVAKYEENCKDIKSELTVQKCREAFHYLAVKGSEKKVKKKYGPRIMECFNAKDKELLIRKNTKSEVKTEKP